MPAKGQFHPPGPPPSQPVGVFYIDVIFFQKGPGYHPLQPIDSRDKQKGRRRLPFLLWFQDVPEASSFRTFRLTHTGIHFEDHPDLMSGAKTTSFLDAVMAEAISLSDANKITLSAAAQDAIKGSENSSKRHKREQVSFDVPSQSGPSSNWDNDAAHLEYLHGQINKERTNKETAEASLETSEENLRLVSQERDKAVSESNHLSMN